MYLQDLYVSGSETLLIFIKNGCPGEQLVAKLASHTCARNRQGTMNSVKSEILDLNRERSAFLGQPRKEENLEEKNLLCCPEFWPQMVGML